MDKLFQILKRHRALRDYISGMQTADTIENNWTDIVGQMSRHVRFSSFRQGVLTIAVDHPMWVNEIDHYGIVIKEKINTLLSNGSVCDIKVIVSADHVSYTTDG